MEASHWSDIEATSRKARLRAQATKLVIEGLQPQPVIRVMLAPDEYRYKPGEIGSVKLPSEYDASEVR